MFVESLAIAALALLVHKIILFIVSIIKTDNSIVDVFYGLGFIVATSAVAFTLGVENIAGCIVLSLIALWGIRLSVRIQMRHTKEDPRYTAWRNEWMQKGKTYFYLRSIVQVFLLQGAIIWIILLPTLALISQPLIPNFFVLVGGVLLWVIGFLFEVVADWQLARFIKLQQPKPAIFTKGLYSISRHPNYFGEALMWWAIWLIAVAAVPAFWWTIISPLVITYVLTKISAPMLEHAFENREGWNEYKKKTSYFIPKMW